MSKIRLHLKPEFIKNEITLSQAYYLHKLKNVLGCKKEQKIFLFNGRGSQWEYKIINISKKEIILSQIKKSRQAKKPQINLTLGFPLIQEKKIDFILQKATELGVSTFTPFISKRTIKKKISQSRIKRWQKIITEACRQSERLWLAQINQPVELEKLIKKNADLKMTGEACGPPLPLLTNTHKTKNIICVVGPEGGFSPAEKENFRKHNFVFFGLSSHILRTETAAIFAAGLISYLIKVKK